MGHSFGSRGFEVGQDRANSAYVRWRYQAKLLTRDIFDDRCF